MIILQKAENACELEGIVLLQVWTKDLSNYGNAQSLFLATAQDFLPRVISGLVTYPIFNQKQEAQLLEKVYCSQPGQKVRDLFGLCPLQRGP